MPIWTSRVFVTAKSGQIKHSTAQVFRAACLMLVSRPGSLVFSPTRDCMQSCSCKTEEINVIVRLNETSIR